MTAMQSGSFACSSIQSKDLSVALSLKPKPGSILSRHERSVNAASEVRITNFLPFLIFTPI